METKKINEVVGDSFEELQIDEMTELQGAGDVDAETTPVVVSAAAITGAVASFEGTVAIAKTCKGHC